MRRPLGSKIPTSRTVTGMMQQEKEEEEEEEVVEKEEEEGNEKADKERTQECSYAHIVGAGWKAAKHVMNVALIKRL